MTNPSLEIVIEKESANEKDKTKAKYKAKKGSGGSASASTDDQGNITINAGKGSSVDLVFSLKDDNWSNYHFATESFHATLDNTSNTEFSVNLAPGNAPRSMTITDLNNDGKQWRYQITLYGKNSNYPNLTLDPVIRNKEN